MSKNPSSFRTTTSTNSLSSSFSSTSSSSSVTRRAQRNLKRSARENTAQGQEATIFGGYLRGGYTVTLSVGTPAQNFDAVVDTATAWSSVVNEDCVMQTVGSSHSNSCPSSTLRYVNRTSSTFSLPSCKEAHCSGLDSSLSPAYYCNANASRCEASVFYLAAAAQESGAVVSDVVRIGDQDGALSARSLFVAVREERSLYEYTSNIDFSGMLGLAQRGLSDDQPTLFDTLVNTYNLSNVFSMCMNDEGGLLVLGGTQPRNYHMPQYVSMLSPELNEGYYAVSAPQINFLGATVVGLSQNAPAVLASTLPFISLPDTAYNSLISAMQSQLCSSAFYNPIVCGFENIFDIGADECLLFEESQLDALPSITFLFSSVLVTLQSRDYIVYAPSDRAGFQYCGVFGFVISDDSNENSTIELGFPFFKAVYTIFDIEQQRVGFAIPEDCGSYYPPAHFSGGSWWGWVAIMVTIGLVVAVCAILVLGNALVQRRRRQRGEYVMPGDVTFSDDPTAEESISETTYLTESTAARYDAAQ